MIIDIPTLTKLAYDAKSEKEKQTLVISGIETNANSLYFDTRLLCKILDATRKTIIVAELVDNALIIRGPRYVFTLRPVKKPLFLEAFKYRTNSRGHALSYSVINIENDTQTIYTSRKSELHALLQAIYPDRTVYVEYPSYT